ncbi:hypothetical protein, partial [Janibacter anophelis]
NGEGEGTDTTTTSSSSSSSSSTTPSSSASSTTESNPDGATAIEVVKNFEKTTNDLRLDPMKETGALGAYATGQAYKQRTFTIRQSREAGESHRGRITVVEATASRQSATSQEVVACTDVSARRSVDKNGEALPSPFDRLERVYTVEKSDGAQQDGKWRVTAEEATSEC